MSFFIIFVIWYNIFGKQNPKIYRAIDGKIGKIFGGVILFSVISSVLPGLSSLMFALLALLICVSPFILIVLFIQWLTGNGPFSNSRRAKNKQTNRDWNTYYQQSVGGQDPYINSRYNQSGGRRGTIDPTLTGLTKSVPKRRKIIQKFNNKYSLNLTDAEIDRIVDASYMSFSWEREIYDMDKDYNSVFEWYNSETCWLRAYLRVFPVQSVSSDFKRQLQICLDVFDDIFNTIKPSTYASVDDCVDAINNRYLTSFDENTFMIAYNFLNANGRKHNLPKAGATKMYSELDRLMSKYDEETTGDTYGTRRVQ
jgi:hypothetical protein